MIRYGPCKSPILTHTYLNEETEVVVKKERKKKRRQN